jgi:hypothetical protein
MRDILAELVRGEQVKRRTLNPSKGKFIQNNQKQISQHCDQWRNRSLTKVQIRVALFLTVSLYLFSGCQKPPQPYGNFAGVDSVDLIQDSAGALHSAYPPAKTRLVSLQPVEDAFGLCLIDSLRNAGYAVAEYAPSEKGGKPMSSADAGLGFAYIIENVQDGDGLRLTLHVGDGTLSRMYRTKQSGDTQQYIPQGFWTRKQ